MKHPKPNELFYLISPSKAISAYVASLKRHVHHCLGHHFDSKQSKAHISLLKNRGWHAERFLYTVNEVAQEVRPFELVVKNLNVFHHGPRRTVYLEVVNKNPLRNLFESLADRKENYTPHITIAKNLEMDEFNKVWRSLKNTSFSDYFLCDHITVLKRSTNKWEHYVNIPFGSN